MAELEDSLAENQAQLNMIALALEADPSNQELIQLKNDLQTLIKLTRDSLGGQSKDKAAGDTIYDVSDEEDDDIQVLNEGSPETNLEAELQSLEGMKVSAPFSTSYSGRSYHNAVIFAVDSESFDNFEDVRVRVVFSHPTETGMVACKHFLEGRCNREGSDCRWSHGEPVSLADLKEWVDPDWSEVEAGSVVLVKQENGVWGRARVKGREDLTLILQLEGSTAETFTEELEKVLPLLGTNNDEEEDQEQGQEQDVEDLEPVVVGESPELNATFTPMVLEIEGRLGEWEGHTRGLGSRLMSKMGWTGGGLGKDGEGRVEPVAARLYPQGKSLDWCMERREKAGGGTGDHISIEKTLKTQAKVEARKSMQRAKKEKARDESAKSLFDLINVKLGGKRGNIAQMFSKDKGSSSSKNGYSNNKKTLKTASNQNLKVENFKLGEKN